jgi:ABC-type multidrug transport system fused ATPase/permease subunit
MNYFQTQKNSEGSILFDKVAFSYPTRPSARILKSLSYGIEPGKSIALVGMYSY